MPLIRTSCSVYCSVYLYMSVCVSVCLYVCVCVCWRRAAMVSYNVIIGDTITKIAVRISGREFHFFVLLVTYHRLNGSSSPVLTATSLSYWKAKNSTPQNQNL